MRNKSKKLLAFALTVLMLVGAVTPIISATTTPATTLDERAYRNAAEGQLLYEVDFRGNDGIYKHEIIGSTGPTLTASADGKEMSMETTAGYSGGQVGDLPLNNETVYTITMGVRLRSTWGFAFYFDRGSDDAKPGMHGFWVTKEKVSHSKQSSRPNFLMYNTVEFTPKNTSSDTTFSEHYYKITIDGPNSLMSFAAMADNGEYVQVYTLNLTDYSAADTSFASDKLNLIFYSLATTGMGARDVKIYKGYTDGSVEVKEQGLLLLDVDDLSAAQTGNGGATYSPVANESDATEGDGLTYSYDAQTSVHTVNATAQNSAIGGKTNLRLGHGNRYTIEYLAKLNPDTASAMGIRYGFNSLKSSQGVYMDKDSFSVANGVRNGADSCNGADVTINDGAKTDGSIFVNDGYAKVAIEIDGYAVTVYINGVKQDMEYSSLKNTKGKAGKGFNDNVLAVTLQQYFDTTAATAASFSYKNIKVYSGLTVTNNYLQVINDGNINVLTISEAEYELPSATKIGYVFCGWKVNGADTVTAAGTKLETKNLDTIESVFVKAMSEVWVQFKDNGNNTKDMRIVSVIDSLAYKNIGYDVVIKYTENGQPKTITKNDLQLTEVYDSLTAKYGTETVTMETLGCDANGGYITAFTIKNVPTNIGEITIELTPYQTALRQTESVSGETITLKLNNGTLVD